MEYSRYYPIHEYKNDEVMRTRSEASAAEKLGDPLHGIGESSVGPRRGSIESTETNNNVLLERSGSVTYEDTFGRGDHGLEHWSHRHTAPAGRSQSMKVAAHTESFEEINGGMGFPYKQIKLPPLEKVVKGDACGESTGQRAAKSVAVVSSLADRGDPHRMSPDFEVFFGDSCKVNDSFDSSFGKKHVLQDMDVFDSEHVREHSAQTAGSRGSFDALVSHGGTKPRRHSMESSVSAFPMRVNGQQRTGYGAYPTVAESLKASLEEPDGAGQEVHALSNNLRRSPLKSIDRVGFTVSSELSSPKRRFRTGPSAAAHASQLVDQHTHPESAHEKMQSSKSSKGTSAITIMDADLHDTFGAHDWVAAAKKEKARSLLVSKAPTLSPIQSPGQQEKISPKFEGMKNYPLASAHLSSDYLQRRKQARLDAEEYDKNGRGYIAEAKRVLNEAMGFMSSPETVSTFDSYSGAIEPLLLHLKSVAGDNRKCRSALRTLALLESNLPNRAIITGLEGRRILLKVVSQCSDIDVQESGIQLLWDLDEQGGANAAEIMTELDLLSFGVVLSKTRNCEIASHVLHFMKIALNQPPELRMYISGPTVLDLSYKLTAETCTHCHYLQDAAQYCLGETLGALLSDVSLPDADVKECLAKILSALLACGEGGQCQLLLTVLSSLAVRRKPRSILIEIEGASKVISFTESTEDTRLQARAFSLLKVLSSGHHKPAKHRGSWYFDLDDHLE